MDPDIAHTLCQSHQATLAEHEALPGDQIPLVLKYIERDSLFLETFIEVAISKVICSQRASCFPFLGQQLIKCIAFKK